MTETYGRYFRDCPYQKIDVYRICLLFGVTDPALQHALKKLLVTGGRGAKDAAQDVREVIASCERWLQMRREEESTSDTVDTSSNVVDSSVVMKATVGSDTNATDDLDRQPQIPAKDAERGSRDGE